MTTREYQKLEEVLPIVLVLIKNEADKQLASEIRQSEFYALDWVRSLLSRLSDKNSVLTSEEFEYFKAMAKRLSVEDYMNCNKDSLSLNSMRSVSSEISEVIKSIKIYFDAL